MERGTIMLRLKLCIAVVLLVAVSATAAAPQKRAAAKSKAAQQAATQPTPPPAPPPTPEQLPAVQPRVSFQNGLLSIEANNSTMYDVLSAVKRQTGANIDVPLGSAADRVVTRIGPGKPRDVMASLLSGSKFNYIIVGAAQNPDGIQRVILSRRPAGAAPAAASGQASFNPQVIPAPEDEPVEEMEPEPPPEEIAQPEPPPATLQPGQDPNQQQGQQQNPNQAKTPEQLLQELQRMQQQQQQQQQQQADPNQQQQADPNQQPQQQFPPDRNPEE